MRTSAMSVWIFINLLCFGMCGYLYLIWSQYWMRIEKQKYAEIIENSPKISYNSHSDFKPNKGYVYSSVKDNLTNKLRRSAVGAFWSNTKLAPKQTNRSQSIPSTVLKKGGSPRFPNTHKEILEFDTESYICVDLTTADCLEKTSEFKEALLKEFHRVLMSEGNVFKSGLEIHNPYNVQYTGVNMRGDRTAHEILCALKNVPLRTVTSDDEPFKSEGFKIPEKPLQEDRHFSTCAVVTSAGALLGSRLGRFIDSHDMVLRFNNAPTENLTHDVGSKTTFRILNSQVISKPQYKFLSEPMYRGRSILAWDPANYSATLYDWYRTPDFPLFPVYKRLLMEQPDADVHLLRPEVLWQLWLVLQDSSPYRLRRNPPSSGFIGLWFSLHRCERVRMFEYVPSVRASSRCHYHRPGNDTGCTLGAWHPLAQEKALAERIRDNSDLQVFQKGFIDVPGFRTLDC